MRTTIAALALLALLPASCKATPGLAEYEEAKTLFQEGKLDESIEAAQRSLDENPYAFPTRWLLATIYERQGQWRDAVDELQQILAVPEVDPRIAVIAGNRIGEILVRNGHREQAKRFFETCLEHDEGFLPARMNLGVMAFEEGDPDVALYHFDRVAKAYPEIGQAHLYLANVLVFLDRREEAREQFRLALDCEDLTPEHRKKAEEFLAGSGQ